MTDLRQLTDIDVLDRAGALALLDRADALHGHATARAPALDRLAGRTVVNLFFENSTRTRTSFSLAARRLGAEVIDFNAHTSSTAKGESLVDTWRTLDAMGCHAYVIRHGSDDAVAELAKVAGPEVAIVNAGSGASAHPTQALLDAMTIRHHKGDWSGLRVLIVGDIRHSRVARSNIKLLRLLGVGELRTAAPPSLRAADLSDPDIVHFDALGPALEGCDVVMTLRLQKERMQGANIPDGEHYFRQWGLTPERLALAKPDAIVMHPGPMNRGTEIDGAVADGPQSVILEQVGNGVAIRMAVLETVLGAA
ncbi:aspartate carbamoyltransferase catalytic subunit [Pseudofulvimonas gallinarii]|uniref:Aspartate carbamoyltransferase n=1 Tax=Pseudofulvimonas gallinarii TaxID=634155 RepID=A0A4S3KSB4_9GAMM|nr:aspartate carbamoyltransferase catalytic subunit [Pseudofulvimonas gallinarii]TCT00648.1 aspartate carbamoyltransferase [Pseudofulvimonas gallinarii]THD12012.1 aspartate carbamoyltransferase [Pseudofulvimonas gallinarii]